MQRWGKTVGGVQRWHCFYCKKTEIKKRPDRQRSGVIFLLKKWLSGNATLKELAKQKRVTIQTLSRHFKSCWQQPCAALSKSDDQILILDGTCISSDCALLIVMNAKTNSPIAWCPTVRESYASWKIFLDKLPQEPSHVVCDGHSGLIKAVRERWPNAQIQRCLAHVLRELRKILTRHPKLPASIALKILVNELSKIKTRLQKRKWIRKLFRWRRKHNKFLKEKTVTFYGHWHYTHRSLCRARTHLFRALPNLFRYIKNYEVPCTSNQLEGGINSPIKDLIRKHRGMDTRRKLILSSFYLQKRVKKPTQNVH